MSAQFKKLTELTENRRPVEEVLKGLKAASRRDSQEAGQSLLMEAKEYGIDLKSYLTLAVDPRKGHFANDNLSGWETSLAYLNLPIKASYKDGVTLEAAADTFQTYPGTRAMFQPVIDEIIRWNYHQDQFESVDPLLATSSTSNGVEMISTVVDDESDDYKVVSPTAEGARFKVRSIRTTENTVKFWKHGGAIRFTYEFGRRASLDLMTPYGNRMERELQISKVGAAVDMLVNGDSVHNAAPVVNQSTLKPVGAGTSAAGQINWECLLAWLVSRAKAGTPVDTVVGNWDTYLQWQLMFAKPEIDQGYTKSDVLNRAGVSTGTINPRLISNLNFAVASSAPSSKLLGFSRGDTLEELKEAGSQISEQERMILNQTVTVVKSENTGYRLAFGDTRSILNLDAVTA